MHKHLAILVLASVCAMRAVAFWPFGSGGAETNKPPKLATLMQKANDLLDQAEILAAENKREEALAKYREALAEMDALNAKYPEQTNSAIFRSRRLQCMTRIDAFKLEDTSMTSYPVNVTDTRELQRRYEETQGIKRQDPAVTPAAVPAPVAPVAPISPVAPVAPPQRKAPAAPAAAPAAPVDVAASIQSAKVAIRAGDAKTAERHVLAALKPDPRNKEALYLLAYVSRMKGDSVMAARALAYVTNPLLKPGAKPSKQDCPALLLYAAVKKEQGDTRTARTALDAAIRADPSSYFAYYNMAILLSDDGVDVNTARAYYNAGRKKGGPQDPEIEARLKAGEGSR